MKPREPPHLDDLNPSRARQLVRERPLQRAVLDDAQIKAQAQAFRCQWTLDNGACWNIGAGEVATWAYRIEAPRRAAADWLGSMEVYADRPLPAE